MMGLRNAVLMAAMLVVPSVCIAGSLEDLLVEKGIVTKDEVAGTSAAASKAKVYWKNGTRFEFPDEGFNSTFFVLMRERYTFTDKEVGKNTSSFEQKNARVYFTGSALQNEFSYTLMGDFVGATKDGENTAALKDAFINWNPTDWLEMRMGQFPTFNTRQFPTSPAKWQFPDLAAATAFFQYGRQQGISATAKTCDKSFQITAGMFNGTSDGEGENKPGVDTEHLGIVALRYNPLNNIDPYEEADVNFSKDAGLSFGVNYSYGQANNDYGAGLLGSDTNSVGADMIFKYAGFSLAGEFFYRDIQLDDDSDSIQPLGFYTQAGYFVVPSKVEVAARYSLLDCDDGKATSGSCKGSDKVNEVAGELNYYFWKNNLKATAAWVMQEQELLEGAPGEKHPKTNRWIFQLSSYF